MLRLALAPAMAYGAILILMAVFQRSLIYHPSRVDSIPDPSTSLPGLVVEAVTVPTDHGGALRGWWMSKPIRRRADERPVVLYFCGNGGNRQMRLDEFRLLSELGADVVCCDHCGYGDSPGIPTEAGLIAGAHGVWKFVTEARKVPRERVLLFGESLGGGVATQLGADLSAAGTPAAGLILRSTFTSLPDAAAFHYPWLPAGLLLVDRFASIERIPQITCPILIVHGKRDQTVPWELGKKLFDAASERSSNGKAKRMITLPEADHNDVLETEGPAFQKSVRDFLKDIYPQPKAPPKRSAMFGPIERTLIYHPVRSENLAPALAGLHNGLGRSIVVPVRDGQLRLNGWHVVRREPSPATNGATATRWLTLFFPGNGGNRAYRVPEIEVLLAAGSNVLIVDYRGYGDNPGAPSERAIAADAREFWKFATDELRVPDTQIILYGESLGGGVATRLAAELSQEGTPPAALILRSTFSRLPDVATEHYPWFPVRFFMGERYASIERIAAVTAPILILHGERDGVVQYEHGVKLFEAAPATATDGTPKQFVTLPRADHNDVLETEPERFSAAIASFVQGLKS